MSEVLASEIMAAAGARELRDGEVVVVGLGLPQVACVLAKRTHAPRLSALLEIGVMNMSPIDTAVGLADCRIWYKATCWSGFLDIMGMNVHRGVVDVGFLGALEVDRFGNINTTLLKEDSGKVRYFNGSAGGNDIASLAKRVIMIMRHEKRKLPEAMRYSISDTAEYGDYTRGPRIVNAQDPRRDEEDFSRKSNPENSPNNGWTRTNPASGNSSWPCAKRSRTRRSKRLARSCAR